MTSRHRPAPASDHNEGVRRGVGERQNCCFPPVVSFRPAPESFQNPVSAYKTPTAQASCVFLKAEDLLASLPEFYDGCATPLHMRPSLPMHPRPAALCR